MTLEEFLPDPPEMRQYWKQDGDWGPQGKRYRHNHIDLMVLVTMPDPGFVEHYNGEQWVHVSCSHSSRMPSYQEMAEVKRAFIGDNRVAYSIWPKARVHVNIHPFCLHLWHRLDAEPIPTFGEQGTI